MLWGVDRSTFRALVIRSMAERRQRYEATLRGMAVFRHLSQGQLAAVADCLHQEVFEVSWQQPRQEARASAAFWQRHSHKRG